MTCPSGTTWSSGEISTGSGSAIDRISRMGSSFMWNEGCIRRSSKKRSASVTGPCSMAVLSGAGSLIGMGAMVLNQAVIGEGSLVAAGAVVREGFKVPPRSLVAGVPAVVKRQLTDEEADRARADGLQLYRLQEHLPRAGARKTAARVRKKRTIHDPQGQGNPRHSAAGIRAVERGRTYRPRDPRRIRLRRDPAAVDGIHRALRPHRW